MQEQKSHDGFFAHPGQICAVFLVKVVTPADISNFVKSHRVERPELSLKRARAFFKQGDCESEGDELQEIETETAEQILIKLQCPITYTPIRVPARGDLCTHLQCFDIDSYIATNHQHKRWKCPQCNRRAHTLIIDSYFQRVLDLVRADDFKGLDRVTLDKNLTICVKQETSTWMYPLIKGAPP